MKPSIGRIVHYVHRDGCEAAVVVRVGVAKLSLEKMGDAACHAACREQALREAYERKCVNLYIFPSNAMEEARGADVVPYCEAEGDCAHDGCWHWPERE